MTGARRLLPLVAGLVLPLLIGASWSCPAAACSCSRGDDAAMFRMSALVVIARVARDQTPDDEQSDWITVERREKGREGARRLRVVPAAMGMAAECGCGPRFPTDGLAYRFYLRPAKDQPGTYEVLDSRRPGRRD